MALLTFPFRIYAQSPNGSLRAEPAFTEVVLNQPDEEKSVAIEYKNDSTSPVSLELFPLDFKQQDETGVISFLGKDAGSFSYSLSSFLTFPVTTLELQPQEKKTVQIAVKNRPDLSPGGHYAAIIARQRNDQRSQSDTAISPSLSTLILLRKTGGERFNLSLKSVNWPDNFIVFAYPSSIHLFFQNEGNVHVVPYGRVEIVDMFGRVIYKGVINTSSARIFPSSRRYINTDLRHITSSLPLSINTISMKGNDSLHKTTFSYSESFIYINLFFVVGVIVVMYIAFRIIKTRKKKNV
jgi:hypothetical protein